MTRRVDVFFYGLFMDVALLRSKGLDPQGVEMASVDGFRVRIGQRAALLAESGHRVHGLVMSLTLAELDRLYAEPSVAAYQPQAVLARLKSGAMIPALCYNLAEPPAASERNPAYAAKLRDVATHVGLPADYIASID